MRSCARDDTFSKKHYHSPRDACCLRGGLRVASTIDAVLLMALGGPESMDEVRPFITAVLGGRKVPPRRIEEVVHHYEAVGGRSPLTELTLQQARALEARLASDGLPVPVFVGMRCWTPWLADTVQEMARRGVRRAAVVILSAQPDRSTESQYQGSLANACNALDGPTPEFVHVPPWHDHPLYGGGLVPGIPEQSVRYRNRPLCGDTYRCCEFDHPESDRNRGLCVFRESPHHIGHGRVQRHHRERNG